MRAGIRDADAKLILSLCDRWYSGGAGSVAALRSPVNFAEYDVERAKDRRNVG
jgi:hypothetical protein